MITIQKQSVAYWFMAEYLATAHAVKEKIRLYERQYGQTGAEFSQKVRGAQARRPRLHHCAPSRP